MNKPNDCKCLASAELKVGTTDGPWYSTLMPSESYDSMRTLHFPNTCNVQQLAGTGKASLSTRRSAGVYPNSYNIVTRERDELFIYGGFPGEGDGAYVARIDPNDLSEQWRINFKAAVENTHRNNLFNWPGVIGVHGNGFLYAIAGNILAKIDAATSEYSTVTLPEHSDIPGGAAYNGFVISGKGVLFAKSLERGTTVVNGYFGLKAVAKHGIPAILVAVDPDNLTILAQTELPEVSLGRVTVSQHAGIEYVYLAGATKLWRYRFTGDQFILDQEWQPVYAKDGEQPGSGCGMLNDWVIVQTNFSSSTKPLRISAFHVEDCNRSHTIQPFPDGTPSQEFSKSGIDPENMRVYAADQLVGKVAGLDFDENEGFSISWQAQQRMASFWAIVGPKERRNIIGTNFELDGTLGEALNDSSGKDYVLWRDAGSGELLVCSDALDSKFNGSIVSSGFEGRFYYLAADNQQIVELSFGP